MIKSLIDLRNSLDNTLQWTIIWWSITLISVILVSWKNWKQEKFFKLQKNSEEIIFYLRQRQEVRDLLKEMIDEKELLWNTASSYWSWDLFIDSSDWDKYTKLQNESEKLRTETQKLKDKYTSKIQIYFSEFWFTKIRDLSIDLSQSTQKETDILNNKKINSDDKIKLYTEQWLNSINCSSKLKETIIKKVRNYGRPWYKNIVYYFIESYN